MISVLSKKVQLVFAGFLLIQPALSAGYVLGQETSSSVESDLGAEIIKEPAPSLPGEDLPSDDETEQQGRLKRENNATTNTACAHLDVPDKKYCTGSSTKKGKEKVYAYNKHNLTVNFAEEGREGSQVYAKNDKSFSYVV